MAKDLLRKIIPRKLEIGDGFIITSQGGISTQCDLIIYDKPKELSKFGLAKPPRSWCYVKEAEE